MPPTTTYRRGDVVLVDVAFSGMVVGSKHRPGIVISTNRFNRAGTKLIIAAITGNVAPPMRPGDTLLADWVVAGLLKTSAVRGVLVTVDKTDVYRTLGTLSPKDLKSVESGLASILGFTVPA